MELYQENIYHIYNRGNHSTRIFFEHENYLFFLRKMRRHLLTHCDLLAWCLMPNHFHWLVHVKKCNENPVKSLNKDIGVLLRSYTRAINKKYDLNGSLFQQKTKAKNVNLDVKSRDNYPLVCFIYIHQNPIRSKLEKELGEWKFSSFRDYARIRNGSLCNIKLARQFLDLPDNSEHFMKLSQKTLPDDLVDEIF